MTWSPRAEMTWRSDPAVDAARKMPGWSEFHRACGRVALYFDHIERDGRRGPYVATSFTAVRRGDHYATTRLSEGRGPTVIAALEQAYRKAERRAIEAEPWLERMLTPTAPEPDYAALLGVADDDDFMELIG